MAINRNITGIKVDDAADNGKVPAFNSTTKVFDMTAAGGAPEGTAVLSTGEAGGTKYLRENGDGTCSWQAVAGGSSTETLAMIAPQVNISSVGDTYTDTSGNTYAETTNQTRVTFSNIRVVLSSAHISAHVSAGTGTLQFWNFTDSAELGTTTTTATSETTLSAITSNSVITNMGDAITLRVKNSGAGGTFTIDSGGVVCGDNTQQIGSASISSWGMTNGGYPVSFQISIMKVISTATATMQLGSYSGTTPLNINSEQTTNIGDTFGTADFGTVVTRTPAVKSFGGSGLVVLTTALSGTLKCGFSWQGKSDNI
jgi:hypothetical protein